MRDDEPQAEAATGSRVGAGTRTTAAGCVVEGARRVARTPSVLAGVWLLTLLLGIPFALALHDSLASHFGSSLAASEAAQGFGTGWWGEYAARVRAGGSGLASTFTPSVIGFAATLRNLSDLVDGESPIPLLAGVIVLWLLAWTFLWGGILDRYARAGGTAVPARASEAGRTAAFFAACGAHAGRMLRLALMSGIAYVVLMGIVHPLLFESLYGALTREGSVERTAFLIRLALYALFALPFLAVHLLTDLARVRAVVEDRRSMLGAYVAGWRLLKAHPRTVLGIYGLTAAAFAVLLALWALVAPGGRGAGPWIWITFAVSQLYLLARLWLKLQLPAALTALAQAAPVFAHPTSDRSPVTVWPESPAAREE